MAIKNRIAEILAERGFRKAVPTEKLLIDFEMTLHRFNKIIENKVDMSTSEAARFASWLDVSIEDMITNEEVVPLKDKFSLGK